MVLDYCNCRGNRRDLGWLSSDGKSDGVVGGGCMGGMAAIGCLARLALAAIGIIIILWLFEAVFG